MMRPAALAFVFVCIGADALPAFAQAESASAMDDATKKASERFRRGVELYREGSFDAALAEFELAHEISPNYRVLYNIGQVQVQRGDYVGASKAFRTYLDKGRDEVSALRRSEVEAELERLQGRIAKLRVESNVEGAELLVDGVSLGTLPMDEVPVNAGVRRVLVKKEGYAPHEAPVTLAGGEVTALEVELEAQESAGAQADGSRAETSILTPPSPADRSKGSSSTGFWVSLAATGGAAIATGISAWRTQVADDDYDAKLETYPGSPTQISNAEDRLVRNALITDICAGATAVGLGFTLYFAFSDGDSEDPTADQATLRTGPRGLGWEVSGSF